MTVGRYDDTTWAVYDANGDVLAYGFFTSQDAHNWISSGGRDWSAWTTASLCGL